MDRSFRYVLSDKISLSKNHFTQYGLVSLLKVIGKLLKGGVKTNYTKLSHLPDWVDFFILPQLFGTFS